ncbi:SAM-dependent DNA methyltransferase, partial [Testudinibacter sp. TR-2022]
MARNETKTDLWVYDLLKIAGLNLSAQGSDIVEIDTALKTASKSKTGNIGRPEYCGVVQDFLIVIEDKADTANHLKLNDKELICDNAASVRDFAVNGALHYGIHLAANTSYKKIIAIGVSGDEKRHRITPLF